MDNAKPKRKYIRRKPYKRKINTQIVEALDKEGLKLREIAENQQVDVSTISRYLKSITKENQALEQYKDNISKGEITIVAKANGIIDYLMDSMQPGYLNALNVNQKNATIQTMNIAKGTAYDKYRTETGQVSVITGHVHADLADIKKLRANQQAKQVDNE